MSIASFSRFEGTDFIAFAVCGAVGYFVGSFAAEGSAVAIYGAILISYHLFLAWLILFSGGDHKEAGVSLPVGHTIVTHLACLAVIVAPIAIARHTIPNFLPTVAPAALAATAEDMQAWHQYLAQQKPGSRATGGSLKAEYEQWLLARQQGRATKSPQT